MKGRLRTYLFFIVSFNLLIGCGQTIYGQDEEAIKVETVLLNIPVFVNDRNGKPVKGLNKDDFELFINGQKQKIDFFADKGAVNIAIVIDANSNTSEVLDRMRRDAQQLVRLLGPDDRAMVIRFDIGYKVLAELTSDKSKLLRAIGGIDSHRERVRLMDYTLHQTIFYELANVTGKRAVVVLGDPDSAISWYDIKPEPSLHTPVFLAESEMPVYPIFYQTHSIPRELMGKMVTLEKLMNVAPVRNFYYYATLTGGRFYAADADNFKSAFNQIIENIRHQYMLGMHFDEDLAGKSVDLNIKISRPELIVRSKPKVVASDKEERKMWVDRFLAASKGGRPQAK